MHRFLESERLALRRFIASDIDNLYALDSDPKVMRFINGGLPTPRTVIENEILPRYLQEYERYEGYGHWAAVEKSTQEFVGWFSLRPREDASAGDVELGYRLRASAWGCGYATEGARTLIRRGFTELGMTRVFATTYEDKPRLPTGYAQGGHATGAVLPAHERRSRGWSHQPYRLQRSLGWRRCRVCITERGVGEAGGGWAADSTVDAERTDSVRANSHR